jgi:endoglucanase
MARSLRKRITCYLAILLLAAGALVAVTPRRSQPEPEPNRYEAEQAAISQGLVETDHAGFSGTGFVNANGGPNVDYLEIAP